MAFRLSVVNLDNPNPEENFVRDFDQDIVTLGRHSSNDIQIVHSGASRLHCKIIFEEGNFFLIDPGSANGTLLNGKKIPLKRNQLLKNNDIVGVESYEVTFKTMDRVAIKAPGENTDEVALRVVREVLGSLQNKDFPTLEIIAGPNVGKVIELNKDIQEIILGRSESCDVPLNDAMISRRNTRIKSDWSGVTVFDLNSKNGTTVNGSNITEHLLKNGDEIGIGETRVIYHNPKEAFRKGFESSTPNLEPAKPLTTVPPKPLTKRPPPEAPAVSEPPPLPTSSSAHPHEVVEGGSGSYVLPAHTEGDGETGLHSILHSFTTLDLVIFLISFVVLVGGIVIFVKILF